MSTFLSPFAQVSLFFHITSTTLLAFLALLHASFPPSPIMFLVPGLWSFTRCDGLAGAPSLATVVAGYSLASPTLSRLSTHLFYHFEGSQALSPLSPQFHSYPGSRSRSCPHLCTRAYSHPRPRSRPRLRPCYRNRFLPFGPGTLFSPRYHIIGQEPGLAPEATGCYLQVPPPIYRDDAARGMAVPGLLLCFFPGVAGSNVLLSLPFPLPSCSLFRLRSRPCSCSGPLSRLRYCPRFRPSSRPRSRLALALSFPPPFPFPPSSRSHPLSRLAFVLLPPLRFLFPLRP